MENEQLLIDQAVYLEAGVHIGTKITTPGMRRFVYKIREDGLFLLNLGTINERIMLAAKMLSKFEPSQIVVTASRIYAISAATKFAEVTGMKLMAGHLYDFWNLARAFLPRNFCGSMLLESATMSVLS